MKLTGVTFAYGEKSVFTGLSLTLPNTGITGLSAPSGRGKTTLLRLLAGLETASSGTVEGVRKGEFAFLFQENRLFDGLTCRGQVSAVLPRGMDPMPYLVAVGLGAEADARVETLSGGMQRRLALARCLAYGREKRVLLLDEPFAGVDADTARSIVDYIRAHGWTVVLSAHGQETLALCDTVVEL